MLNKVTLIGRLGNAPEINHMPSGGAVANISLATGRRWKDKQTGEKKEETEWHRVCFFNRLAEVVGEYLAKGSLIYVEGRIRTRKWQDQQGNDRYSTEIIAESMQMLDSKGGGGQPANNLPPSANPNVPPVGATAPASLDDFDDAPF